VDTILHDDLKLQKDSARLVPRMLTNVLFHHDNVPPHRAARVHQFFDDNNFEVVPHASYSPDLAPSDFWLFTTLKDVLRGRTFSSI
jgi:transposase